MGKRLMDNVALKHQVFVDEVGRVSVIGVNATHLGGTKIHFIYALGGKEIGDGGLVTQI